MSREHVDYRSPSKQAGLIGKFSGRRIANMRIGDLGSDGYRVRCECGDERLVRPDRVSNWFSRRVKCVRCERCGVTP